MWWTDEGGGADVERGREGVATHHLTDCTLAVPDCTSAPPATLSTSTLP